MEFNKNSKFAKLAKEFMATKSRKDYYEITAFNDEDCEEWRFLNAFTEEELNALQQLREKYGMQDFFNHLDEVITDPDELHDLSVGLEITSFDLDTPYHQYRFGRHELVKGELVRHEMLIEISDDKYVRLLELCLSDGGMNMNKLRYADRSIYNELMREVDLHLTDDHYYIGNYPFLVTMDELMEDVEQIFAAHPELERMDYVFTGYPF